MKTKILLCSLLFAMAGCGTPSAQNKQFDTYGRIYKVVLEGATICVEAGWFSDEQLDLLDTLSTKGEKCFDQWAISLTEPNALPFDGLECAANIIKAIIKLQNQAERRPR